MKFAQVNGLVALVGCVYQIYAISWQYLQYETVSNLQIDRPATVTPPSVILCLEFKFAVSQRTIFDQHLGSDEEFFEKATVGQLFNFTAPAEGLIKNCTIKYSGSYGQATALSELCHELITVRKFLKQQYVCYSFTIDDQNKFYRSHITNARKPPRFYEVFLSKSFPRSRFVVFFVHDRSLDFYGLSDSFSEHFRHIANSTSGSGSANAIILSYKRFKTTSLPAPYKTNCFNYSLIGYQSKDHCSEDCVIKETLRDTGRLPFSVALYDANLTTMVIQQVDIENGSYTRLLNQMDAVCTSKCPWSDCHANDHVAVILTSFASLDLGFELYLTNEPYVITEHKARQMLIDYVSFILSCISFWFGFSPYSFGNGAIDRINLLRRRTHGRKMAAGGRFEKRGPSALFGGGGGVGGALSMPRRRPFYRTQALVAGS
ncbi:hypothetical protein HDE_01195 [Halotydeus destructor]|nr:hypothetical protein HDE_01195 [Halotydeus destructor]